ncbi:MAG: inositol monophosphatase [Vicinamibacteria bacterium]|nr:inositol monophosphatase [Vicinamibacteria bacterium]
MSFPETVDVDLYRAVAADAALIAGQLQKERLGTDIGVENKGDLDLVTEVDRACEAAILGRLRRSFPGHDFVAEESAPSLSGSEFVWYIDPLDGTTNYAHGYPFFCTSIALTQRGTVIAGAVYDPVKEELFTAARGRGATCNGAPLRVSKSHDLLRSVFVTGFPYDLRDDVRHTVRLFERFLHHARALRRDGAAALDLAYLAAGRIDGYFEERLKPWDVLAGALLVEEAGGRVSRFDGSPIGVAADEVVASNGALHEAMLRVLAEPPPTR